MIKIDKHIYLLNVPGFRFPYCNCLWIEDDINCLVDSSPAPQGLAFLQEKKVDLILDTHAHIDHFSCNHHFPQARIMMHHGDLEMARSSACYQKLFGIDDYVDDERTKELFLKVIGYRSTRVDETIAEGRIINLGAIHMETIHLPGHSPGHCGFLFPQQGFIFTSDIDLAKFGSWYGTLNCSLANFFASIERLLDFQPDFIITGHGEGIVQEGVTRKLKEYRDIMYAREKRIVDLLAQGRRTLSDIARELPVYRRLPNPQKLFFAYEQVMVLVHLRYLQESGRVFQEEERYYLT